MAASSASGAGLGEEDPHTNASSSPVDVSKAEITDELNGIVNGKKHEEEPPPPPPVDSETSTPKRGTGSRASEESTMNYTPSPTSDHRKSAETSPQTLNQPVVSHVPASVKQPALQSPEHSSLASLAQQVEGEVSAPQQQPQLLEGKAAGGVPTFQVIHGTQGQVVTKRKGRFKLLQDSEHTPGTNIAASDSLGAGGIVAPGAATGTVQAPVIAVVGLEGGVPITHPTCERSLSNTSTLSAMSVQNQPAAASAMPASGSSNTLNADSPGHPHANGAPVGKKKGRFVVIPGDVTDPSLLRQPFTGHQGALRQQNLQPSAVVEQVLVNTPQSAVVAVAQPVPLVQNMVQQVPVGDSQHYQVPSNVTQQHAQSIAGSVQHHLQQINAPQYYSAAPPQAQVGGTPQVLQVNFPQQQQQQVGPVVTQMQPRTSHSPVPPSAQPHSHQQNLQPSAQIAVSDTASQPTYFVQTEDGRYHQVVAAQQYIVPIPDQQMAMVPQDTSISQQQQQHAHPQSGLLLPQIASGDAPKAPQVQKPTAVKRPAVQRNSSVSKGAPANVGFGKVFYFLEQMKLEVTEAERTIKNQGRDMKFLVSF